MNPGFKPFTDEHECLSYRKKERKKNCADISLFSVDVNMGKGAFIILLPNTSE